ncbi:MAG: type I polyketide synthase [Chthoniobacterales bacterium]
MSQSQASREQLSPLKRAILELRELRAKLEGADRSQREPIAIIGMGFRLPGGAHEESSLWRILSDGIDVITEIPGDRWDLEAYYDPDPDMPGKMNCRHGAFLSGVDRFDAEFFGISPREAASMDPQHRLLLETSWQALENAAIAPASLRDTKMGAFVGVSTNDYGRMVYDDEEGIDAYSTVGNSYSAAAGRLSYFFGVHGPSMAIDTACSSSLVAVHQACRSLRQGECNLALAAGVNVILTPQANINFCKSRMLASDGRCKTFDASADGYVRGEGCAVLVLKPLSSALASGDRILAVIRGSAVNQDGRSGGLTAPNGPAQEAVIREALVAADVVPHEVSYLEAHGTGTSLGDPIEVRAACAVLCKDRSPDQPLAIGSIKTNIGHLEAAAGIAGLLKVILAFQHKLIPANLHLKKKNPYIDWDRWPIVIPTALTPWNPANGRRIAGVSSFGFSGTNAHVIVSEPPPAEISSELPGQNAVQLSATPVQLLPLSARNESALLELAGRYQQLFSKNPNLQLADVCHTAGIGRSHFEYRLAMVAADLPEAEERLAAFLSDRKDRGFSGRRIKSVTPGVVFMFSGQGSQYPGMARELFETQPVFRRELEKCAEILKPLFPVPLLELFFADDSQSRDENKENLLSQTQYTQPVLFALEYALATMWRSWGVEPVTVLGHSVGEYVAACVAGVFSLEDGLQLIAERGRLIGALPAGGMMAAVSADESRVAKAIQARGSRVAVACINGPANVVVSGESEEIESLLSALKDEGVHSRSLVVSHAFHSELMDPILDSFVRAAAKVRYSEPLIPIVSNVTGRLVTPGLMSNPEYWRGHIRKPVQFAGSIRFLRETGQSVFLEIGPQPVLSVMARATAPETDVVWAMSLNRSQKNWESLLEAASTLYVHGIDLDWRCLPTTRKGKPISLPTYPFQRSRFWLENRKPHDDTVAPVAGSDAESWFYCLEWRAQRPLAMAAGRGGIGRADFTSAVMGEDKSKKISHGFWIVLGDADGIGEIVADFISERGQECVLVSPAQEYQFGKGTRAKIDPLRPKDFERLFLEASEAHMCPLNGVLNLWPGNEQIGTETTATEWEAAQQRVAAGVLHATQAFLALPSYSSSRDARIWIVTRGGQPVPFEGSSSDRVSEPIQALAWGLARVISLEHPGRFGAIIDLDPVTAGRESAAALWSEIELGDDEDAVAYRDGQRFLPRLVHTERPPAKPFSLSSRGSYVVTGGLGGLGLLITEWLAARGAGQIVLVSRRAFPDRRLWSDLPTDDPHRAVVQTIIRAEKLGSKVTVEQGDVGNEEAMRVILDPFSKADFPLRGIIHCAMDMTGYSIRDLDLEAFRKMCHPKALGAWVLHRLTSEMDLDFFILFSSITALWGASGLGHYAAANQTLDSLANWRRRRGLPALSVNWGTWDEMRVATKADKELFERAGLRPMPAARALAALERLIQNHTGTADHSSAVASAVVASVDWEALRGVYEARRARPIFSEIQSQRAEFQKSRIERLSISRPDFLGQLRRAPASRRREILVAQLRSLAGEVLGFEPCREIDLEQGLFDMGMDSLMAVELKGRLERSLDLQLSSSVMFDYPNIRALTDYILTEAFDSEPFKETTGALSNGAQALSDIEALNDASEDEIANLLLTRLEQLK